MGCPEGCSGGANRMTSPAQIQQLQQIAEQSGPCEYTVELLQSWFDKLTAIKANNQADLIGITYARLNACLGIVQSAINYSTYPCYFSNLLAPIVQVINSIDAL